MLTLLPLLLLPLPAAVCVEFLLPVLSLAAFSWVSYVFFLSVLELHTLFFGPGLWAAALSCLSLSPPCSLSLSFYSSHSLGDSLHYFVMTIWVAQACSVLVFVAIDIVIIVVVETL